jgi:hypothetical protein
MALLFFFTFKRALPQQLIEIALLVTSTLYVIGTDFVGLFQRSASFSRSAVSNPPARYERHIQASTTCIRLDKTRVLPVAKFHCGLQLKPSVFLISLLPV